MPWMPSMMMYLRLLIQVWILPHWTLSLTTPEAVLTLRPSSFWLHAIERDASVNVIGWHSVHDMMPIDSGRCSQRRLRQGRPIWQRDVIGGPASLNRAPHGRVLRRHRRRHWRTFHAWLYVSLMIRCLWKGLLCIHGFAALSVVPAFAQHPQTTQRKESLGPKSQGGRKSRSTCARSTWLFVLVFLMLCHQAAGVRVERPHSGRSGAAHSSSMLASSSAAKQSDGRNNYRPPLPIFARKRALMRAITRAQSSEHNGTFYRGRWKTLAQLRAGHSGARTSPSAGAREISQADQGPRGRLRIVTWNCGGLPSHRYQEFLLWLKEEHRAGRPVDVACLQETAWTSDSEFMTAQENELDPQWYAIHSGCAMSKTGILCLVSTKCCSPERVRYVAPMPGRLLQVRLQSEPPLDCLLVYQQAWNPKKFAHAGVEGTRGLLQARQEIWQHIGKWLRAVPARNGCLVVGDFNTPVKPDAPLVGQGVASSKYAQTDQDALQALVVQHRLHVLNSWSRGGLAARTFLPAVGDQQHGTQIDFIMARDALVDMTAKRARPFVAPFVPVTGCRHIPVSCTIRRPCVPRTTQAPPRRDAAVRQQLEDPRVQSAFQTCVASRMEGATPDTMDALLLDAWAACRETVTIAPKVPSPREARASVATSEMAGEALQQGVQYFQDNVRTLWRLRDALRAIRSDGTTRSTLAGMMRAWRLVGRIQQVTKTLKKACREKKRLKVEMVLASNNIHKAAKSLAPKAPRRKLQLRDADGKVQLIEVEFEQIKQYFEDLYTGTEVEPACASPPLQVTEAEVQDALCHLAPAKVVPRACAPAVLWRQAAPAVQSILTQWYNHAFATQWLTLPRTWSSSELVLLPKVGKALRSAADLRPISLLPPCSKMLAYMLAQRLKDKVGAFLADVPQYAYVAGRSLQSALDRTVAHCAEVRSLLASQSMNIHHKHAGKTRLELGGGCQLSLDISKAYDMLPRDKLVRALRMAGVDGSMIDVVVAVHAQARLQIHHATLCADIGTSRGLRQGCGWPRYYGRSTRARCSRTWMRSSLGGWLRPTPPMPTIFTSHG